MSTFLQLVQDLHREVGAAGSAPETVANQTGEASRLVNWIKRAELHIQNLWTDWKFLRDTFSFVTTAGDNTISGIDLPGALATWDMRTFQILFPGDTLKQDLPAFEYEQIKDEVLDTSVNGPIWRVIIMPDGSLQTDPPPDGAYTIYADYYKTPTQLAADADVSVIPVRYHPIIVAKAQQYYGLFENAPEQVTEGESIFEDYIARLENDQLPNKNNSRYRSGSQIVIRPE